jgi:hypothetical protein
MGLLLAKTCVTTFFPTYIKDTTDLIKTLCVTILNGLPVGAKIFSADAVSVSSKLQKYQQQFE